MVDQCSQGCLERLLSDIAYAQGLALAKVPATDAALMKGPQLNLAIDLAACTTCSNTIVRQQ